MIKVEEIENFINENFGDVLVVKHENVGDDVKVVWREYGIKEFTFFSVIGYNKQGRLIVKIEGEC